MFDYQRIVDDVRGALATAGAETIDALRLAAADYSAACDEVNARLRQCGELLRKGLRSEAIQMAEVEPNLLDTVSTLDFPEYDQWRQVTGRFGIAAPMPLQLDVAAELNEAYALEEPLTLLLRRQRLLALARSPIPLRISVLRQLAEADPDNPVWREDLRVFEQERQRELQSEVAEAAKASDLERLDVLYQELRDSPWLELPPATLVRWVDSMCDEQVRQENRANLVAATDQLQEALASRDEAYGRQVRDGWQALADSIELDEQDELRGRARSALEWLAAADERDAHLAQSNALLDSLAQALDRNAPMLTLKRLYLNAVREVEQVPGDLELRYRRRLAAERSGKFRRWALAACSAIAAVILIGVVTAYAVRQSAFEEEVQSATATLSKLIDDEKLAEAKDYLDALRRDDATIAESEEVEALAARLEAAWQQEQHRRESFDQALENARKGGAANPAPEALVQAERLAKLPAEKQRLAIVQAEMKKWLDDAQMKADANFLKELPPIDERIAELEGPAHSAKSLLTSVMQLRDECRKVERNHPDAGKLARAAMKPLWDRLATLEERSERLAQEELLLNELQRAAGMPKLHQESLANYAAEFNDTPRGADFKQAASEAQLWEGIACWNEVARVFGGEGALQFDSKAASTQIDVVKRALAQHGGFPLATTFRDRLAYLESVAARRGEGKWIADRLDTLFHDRLLDRVWMIEMATGKRFYLAERPEIESAGLTNITYIADFDLSKKTTTIQGKEIVFNDRAPQVAVSQAVSKAIQELDDENWEPTFLHIITTVQQSRSIEPLLKLSLLQQTIEIGTLGSVVLAKAYEQHLDELKRANIAPFANWLDPHDAKVSEAREEANLVLERLSDRRVAEQKILDECKAIRDLIRDQYDWCGHLLRGPKDDWICQMQDGLPAEGELFVVHLSADPKRVVVERVGAVKSGAAQLEVRAANTASFVEGRPIFLQKHEPAKAQ